MTKKFRNKTGKFDCPNCRTKYRITRNAI
ncbi:MAG: hypothetical protein JW774_10385 [Candidatus Aureabacteria bacterium]|nr:hypothetical protein [Candidatus Auribacterota bacterium]